MALGSSLRRSLRWLPAALTTLLALALYSGWNRPLLYDEFVYFVIGGIPTLPQVLQVIHDTTTNINQGVTGAYMLADWALLKIFGAQAWALRLPSLIFGALFFVYAAIFLRGRRMGPVALAIFPIFMITQELVMHYVGEARTYMPLATASVGILAYYFIDPCERRRASVRLLGWSAMLIGVLFHPYFALYWPVLLVFAFCITTPSPRGVRALINFSNPVLVATGAGIYIAVALLTWTRGRATAYVDPFNFLPGPLPVEIIAQNLYAWITPLALVGAFAAVFVIVVLFLQTHSPLKSAILSGMRVLAAPGALALIAYMLAVLISISSIAADFWIFPRQWIASSALIALAGFWGAWCLWREIDAVSIPRGRTVGALLVVAVLMAALSPLVDQVMSLGEWMARSPESELDQRSLRDSLGRGDVTVDGEWMEFAQSNVDRGDRVWPEFGEYYLGTDWSGFVLSDGSSEPSR